VLTGTSNLNFLASTNYNNNIRHTLYPWASATGEGGRWPPWIFIHGTNIADRGLKVLFFGVVFLLFFGLFFRCPHPLWKFFCRHPCLYLNTILSYTNWLSDCSKLPC